MEGAQHVLSFTVGEQVVGSAQDDTLLATFGYWGRREFPTGTGIDDGKGALPPCTFALGQNYPNPFNPATNIPFELKEPSHVTLKVFDARGREVKELVNGRWGTGKFIADFDVRHGGSATIATGIYFYQIIISGETTHQTFTETRKMMVIK